MIFLLVVVFTVFSQDRVLPHRVDCLPTPMKEFKGGFRTFSREEKSAEEGPHSGSELGADFTPWTPAAYVAPMAAGSLSAEELEELGIWVDEFGRWWSRSGVSPGRWLLHDTSHGPVWWDEPG